MTTKGEAICLGIAMMVSPRQPQPPPRPPRLTRSSPPSR